MAKKKIIFDFDSVLVDFVGPWLEWLREEKYTNFSLKPSDVHSYDWIEKTYGQSVKQFFLADPFATYERVKPYHGAKELLDWCFMIFDEVEILTHASQDSTAAAKLWFINKHFKTNSVRFFGTIENKFKFTEGGILIDDFPFHVIKHVAVNNAPGIVYNHQGQNGWGHLVGYIDLLKEQKPNLQLYHEANSFDEVRKSLLQLF